MKMALSNLPSIMPLYRCIFEWFYAKLTGILIIAVFGLPFYGHAQQPIPITDFVLFSGNGGPGTTTPISPGNAVQVGSSTTITGGNIGSLRLIQSTGSSVMRSNLYSNGTIVLTNSNSVTGKIAASNAFNVSGTIINIGSNANLAGNIDANGNIVVAGGIVSGTVTHPSGTTYTGPAPAGGDFTGTPSLPVYPALPNPTNFPPANTSVADITSSRVITPGNYNGIRLTGNQTLTLRGTGVYVFSLVNNRNSNTFILDFQNSPSGTISIYVHGDMTLGKLTLNTVNGGGASRIYTEVQGKGAGTSKYAFDISNGSTGAKSKWLGTIYAPYAGINVGSGTGGTDYTGALWSGTQVNINSGVSVNYTPFEFCYPPTVNAGEDVNVCANPGAITLTASATGGTAPYSFVWSNGMTGQSITVNPTATTTYTVTVSNANSTCSASDAVTVNVNPALSVNAGADVKVCNNSTTATLTAAASGGKAPYTYVWSANGATIGTTASISVSPTSTTTYTVVAKDSFGAECTATDAVIVNVNPALNVNAGSDVQVCLSNATTLTAAASGGTGPYTYQWFVGNTSVGTTASLTVSPSATTTYTVVAKDSFGAPVACSATDQVTVTVNPAPALEVSDNVVIVCSNEIGGTTATVDLTAYVIVDDGTTVAYSKNGVPISNPENQDVQTGDVIAVVATDGNTCESSASFTVTVNARQIFGICSQGKVYELIGSELTMLNILFDPVTNPITTNEVFFIDGEKVLIEIIYNNRNASDPQELLDLIEVAGGDYGFEFDPDISDLEEDNIIAGFFPIKNLQNLNPLTELIKYVRPAFPPVRGAEDYREKIGGAMTQGDIVMRSDLVRLGYQNEETGFPVSGSGIKVGVLSDSYNTQPLDPAATDVLQDELPGPGDPLGIKKYKNFTPVHVVKEFPAQKYGARSDEGRAMLQIIHDVAPRAELAFRTGFLTAGDFAKGILELQAANCDVIVDDLTYLTEPFFTDGKVAQAVNTVAGMGVSYFTSAGNFGNKSFEGTFNPINPSVTLPRPGKAHDFGGGDGQSITVGPGSYTVVLQWQDPLYSVGGDAPSGSQYDMDIYLHNFLGYELFGFNRVNIGGDPVEILSFSVPEGSAPITTDLMVTRECTDCSSAAPIKFKYVIFRGTITNIENFGNGSSTIVGQANAAGAMTVGAVLYSNTDVIYNTTIPARPADCTADPLPVAPQLTVASFSSIGGMLTNNENRNKPDFTAPNGVNTTVNLSTPNTNFECDPYQNFFGTSAAAPHAAGVAALLLEARNYYYPANAGPPTNVNWTNSNMAQNVRSALKNKSLNMHEAGYDVKSGSGLIKAQSAMLTLAAPNPEIVKLEYPEGTVPGTEQFTLIIKGDNFYEDSEILFGGQPLPGGTTYDPTTGNLSGLIPEFEDYENPPIQVNNDPISSSGLDGGTTDPFYFYGERPKRVRIIVDNPASKKYGERVATELFTARAEVQQADGSYAPIELIEVGLRLGDTPLTDAQNHTIVKLNLTTIADEWSNVNASGYLVTPSHDAVDPYFSNKFIYDAALNQFGNLIVERLPMTVTPKPLTVTYGDRIDNQITFEYLYDKTNIPDAAAFENAIKAKHQSTYYPEQVIGLLDARKLITDSSDRLLTPEDLDNLSFLSGSRGIANGSRGIANGSRGIVNVVDLDKESIYEYQVTPNTTTLTNSRGIANGSRGIVNSRGIANGSRGIVNTANGSRGIANGSRGIANGENGEYGDENNPDSNKDAVVIIHEADVADSTESEIEGLWLIPELYSINLITGLTAGNHYIVPGALLSENLDLDYGLGDLTIEKADLTLTADDKAMAYGGTRPEFTASYEGFQYDDDAATVIASLTFAVTNGDGSVATDPLATGDYIITPTATLKESEYQTFEGNPLVNYNLIVEPGTLNVFCESAAVTSSATSTGGGSAVPTINRPAGVNAGDLMIVGLIHEKGTATTITPPDGWNLIQRTNQSNNLGMGTYWKVAGNAEPDSYSFALSNSPKWSMGISSFECADTSEPITINPIVSFNGASSGAKVSFADAPSVTTTMDKTLVLAFYSNKADASWTPAAGMTEVYDAPNIQQGLTSNMMAYYIQDKAGSTGSKRATATVKEVWVAQQIAIRTGASGSANARTSSSTTTTASNLEFAEKPQDNFSAYPNPVRSHVNIVVKDVSEQPAYSIVDAVGRTYYVNSNWHNTESRLELDFTSLQDGLYSVIVKTEHGSKAIRIVKSME